MVSPGAHSSIHAKIRCIYSIPAPVFPIPPVFTGVFPIPPVLTGINSLESCHLYVICFNLKDKYIYFSVLNYVICDVLWEIVIMYFLLEIYQSQ